MNLQQLEAGLADFYGTEQYYFNPLYPRMKYTDGVKFFILNAGNGAFWFLDIVGTEVHPLALKRREEFVVVTLHVYPAPDKDVAARIFADDGNGNIFWTRELTYTDCPVGEWKFYLENNVFYLPSER